MSEHEAERLIRNLWDNPQEFSDQGRAYDLLQAYFAGFPLETLRPLLGSNDLLVRRAAAFIASELGDRARSLVDDVVPLLVSGDRYLQYNALEVVAVCSHAERVADFAHVVQALESDDKVLRALAMRLVSNADASQLAAARQFFEVSASPNPVHTMALATLTEEGRATPEVISAMIHAADPVIRRYGAIAARRLVREFPYLMTEVGSSDDADLRKFFKAGQAPANPD